MSGILARLQSFDAYPRTLDDFRVRTYSGAIVSIVSGLVILMLFVGEFADYMTVDVNPEVAIDTSFGKDMQISIDITFHALPCAYLSVDAMDVAGVGQLDVEHNIFKKRLDRDGNPISGFEREQELATQKEERIAEATAPLPVDYCGSCYGSELVEGACCNTCEEVRESYRKKGWAFANADGIEQCVREGWSEKMKEQANEGCNVSGHLKVSKVAGNFHFAPGKSFSQHSMHVHDLQPFKTNNFNLSHTINRLTFGSYFPGIENPLDKHSNIATNARGSVMYQYHIKVVSTMYKRASGRVIDTNQFSVTEHSSLIDHDIGTHGLPGVFFMYDTSPMKVTLEERSRSLGHFLTGVCAIIGGVFTFSSLVDTFVYHGVNTLQKKVELGKAS